MSPDQMRANMRSIMVAVNTTRKMKGLEGD